jgi:hypothetical protein
VRILPPDRHWWNPVPRRRLHELRRFAVRESLVASPTLRKRAIALATSGDSNRLAAVLLGAAALQLLRLVLVPRSRVVFRAVLEPGDHVSLLAKRRG